MHIYIVHCYVYYHSYIYEHYLNILYSKYLKDKISETVIASADRRRNMLIRSTKYD